jgi:hypothetical protein
VQTESANHLKALWSKVMVLNIPADNKDPLAETWIGFVSADVQIASNSVYTGQLEV